jgi:hypothetical protein
MLNYQNTPIHQNFFTGVGFRHSEVPRLIHHHCRQCTITAGVAVVSFNFSANRLHKIKTTVATKPQMIATQGSTTEHPAVIAANPPSKPLQTSITF